MCKRWRARPETTPKSHKNCKNCGKQKTSLRETKAPLACRRPVQTVLTYGDAILKRCSQGESPWPPHSACRVHRGSQGSGRHQLINRHNQLQFESGCGCSPRTRWQQMARRIGWRSNHAMRGLMRTRHRLPKEVSARYRSGQELTRDSHTDAVCLRTSVCQSRAEESDRHNLHCRSPCALKSVCPCVLKSVCLEVRVS